MAYTSEIDKLERRHRENPEGRTFAPLADAYRKAGDVPRALEILKYGLQLHPDYLSASIVLGRCHLDMGDLPGAEAAFRRVLELDKENVIAIKALADITERQVRFGESEDWLNYLLSIDGSNEDARLQLTRLSIIREQHDKMATLDLPPSTPETTREAVAPPPEAAPPPRSEPVTAKTPAIRLDLDLDETVEIPPPPVIEATQPMPEALNVGPGLDEILALAQQREEAPPLGEDPMQSALAASDEPLDDDAFRAGDDDEFSVGVERHEDIVLRPSSTSEYQVPSDADLLGGRSSGGFSPGFEEDMPASMAPATPEPETADESASPAGLWQSSQDDATTPEEAAPAGVEHFDEFVPPEDTPVAAEANAEAEIEEPVAEELVEVEEPVEEEPVEEEPVEEEPVEEPAPAPEMVSAESELLVTETMGDVYADQGHHGDALEVYRQLLIRAPADSRLRDKIARLERRTPPPAPAERKTQRGFAAAQTGGQSVSAYFGDLLSSRLEESGNGAASSPDRPGQSADAGSSATMDEAFDEAETPSEGEPTRPASQPLSLSAIFGEDSSPVPPVVSGPESGQPAERKPGSSFDEFFGERSAPPAGGTRTRTIRHSDGDQDDLEQFHKWLKGLK
ncbi:MAG: tetratricopeptide repeat protein, partial [Gemmatimonadota bacterium]